MRILYVHRTSGTRVEGVHIRELVKALVRLGHEVRLVNPPGCDPMAEPLPGAAPTKPGLLRRAMGGLPRALPHWAFELLEIAYSIVSVPRLLATALRWKPEMIYERASTYQVAAAMVARRLRIPLIEEVNQTADIGRLRPVAFPRLARRFERWTFRRARALVTVSTRFKEMIAATACPADKIHVIPNAADPAVFHPDARPAPEIAPSADGSATLGYVGAFLVWHRLDTLLDLVQPKDGRPAIPCRLLLIGDGPEQARLAERVKELRLSDRVQLIGRVSHERLPEYLSCLDAAVMAHATDYASPVKLFEYMAMGMAIVAPAVPPIREIVTDGETALLFQPGDVASMREAVRRVATDGALRDRLGRNARRAAAERHTWTRNAERVIMLAQSEDATK